MNHTTTSSGADPATTAANVALSNYYLAIILLGAAILVIVIALVFTWAYHRRALEVITAGLARAGEGGAFAVVDGGVGALSTGVQIKGPTHAAPSEELFFGIVGAAGRTVVWTAEKSTETSGTGQTFMTSFADPGVYEVSATVEGESESVTKKVTIGAAAPKSASPITIPFALKNWGRLVVVLFGVGVVAALMATAVISAEAGIGILGALLGVGATAAAAGGGDSGASTKSTDAPGAGRD